MKRYRAPKAKPGELKAQWGKLPHDKPGICYAWGSGCSNADAHLLHVILNSRNYFPDGSGGPSLLEELESRGYDTTTFRFSVQKIVSSQDG